MSYPEIKAGEPEYDSGKKFIDANGVPRIIYRKVLDVGALPNTTTKNVPHGVTNMEMAVGSYHKAEVLASNGTITIGRSELVLNVSATNLVITTTDDKSAFEGIGIIEFTKELEE